MLNHRSLKTVKPWALYTLGFIFICFNYPLLSPKEQGENTKDTQKTSEAIQSGNNKVVLTYRQGFSSLELETIEQAINSAQDDRYISQQIEKHLHTSQASHQKDDLYKAKQLLGLWEQKYPLTSQLRLLKASIEQHQHDFQKALDNIHQVLKGTPGSAQAWLTKAMIHQEEKAYQKAIASCYSLAPHTNAIISSACLSSTYDAMKLYDKAFRLLSRAINNNPATYLQLNSQTQQWTQLLLAEYATNIPDIDPKPYFIKAKSFPIDNYYLDKKFSDYLKQSKQLPKKY